MKVRKKNDTERIAVTADYEAVQHGKQVVGRVEFVACVADSMKGYDLLTRAQRAVARRLRVPSQTPKSSAFYRTKRKSECRA